MLDENGIVRTPAKIKQMAIVGAVKDMITLGYSGEDIMEVFHLSESTYRSYLKMINDTEDANKTESLMTDSQTV